MSLLKSVDSIMHTICNSSVIPIFHHISFFVCVKVLISSIPPGALRLPLFLLTSCAFFIFHICWCKFLQALCNFFPLFLPRVLVILSHLHLFLFLHLPASAILRLVAHIVSTSLVFCPGHQSKFPLYPCSICFDIIYTSLKNFLTSLFFLFFLLERLVSSSRVTFL